jgi:nicotinamide riboside transporter PnuC
MSKFAWYAEDKNQKAFLKNDPKEERRQNWICMAVITVFLLAPFADAVVSTAAHTPTIISKIVK